MKKYKFDELFKHVEVFDTLNELEEAYQAYEPDEQNTILNRDFLHHICKKYQLDQKKERRLFLALNEIEESRTVRELYKFLIWDMCLAENRTDRNFLGDFSFCFETAYPDCRKFLLLLACVEPSEQELIRRGIPKEIYGEIPEQRIGPHLVRYQKTGSCQVTDFPWDRNFYTRSIYLFDRFYFIPCQFGDPFHLYRNIHTGEVVGIYDGGYPVAEDGQLTDEKHMDCHAAYRTRRMEVNESITGNYMNPCGFISKEQRCLRKEDWKEALKPGEIMLGFHIPSGEGYDPIHLHSSMKQALDFYDLYFPEFPIRGFWSESWLYDNRLSIILPENSKIVQMQRRFYNYSIGADGSMLKLEVWGDADVELSRVRAKTSLEKNVISAIQAGNRFCTTSMVVLREDVEGIEETYTYIKEEDFKEFDRVVRVPWKKG